MNTFSRLSRPKWLLAILVPAAVTYGVYSLSQTAPPNIRPIELNADPLYAQGSGQKPTLTLSLSVEYPTVGAQYRSGYNINETYPGYFNSEKCYAYDKSATLKNFTISGTATAHNCSGNGFSGNFMNWAASSSIDILRLGLSGGDRIADTANSTILQRAVLQPNFYDSGSFFPQKNITNAVARQSLPSSLFPAGDTANVRISNCLDKVHIYTNGVAPQNTGQAACSNPEVLIGPAIASPPSSSSGYTKCADDNGTCAFTGYREVIFGSGNNWQRRLAKNGLNCNNTVFTPDPAPGPGKSCFIKTTSSVFPMEAVAGNENVLYARATVCDAADDNRPSLCQRYPNGNSKPVGNMQKYSDRLRLSAFGYLMDDNITRYGGVLRAPMTYVGAKSYDANGNPEAGTNPYAEWDANTGVFAINPRNEPEGISGVINYLNRFGRTGTPGKYKSKDVLSELYYESLRYLQGLPPTPQAVAGVVPNSPLKDGYPVYTTWVDPFEGGSSAKNYACLRNSILTIADKNTHYDKSLPGNTRVDGGDFNRTSDVSLAANVPNFVDWTNVVGGFESGNSNAYVDGNGVGRNTNNPTAVVDAALANIASMNTGATAASYYMAGAAYWAHTHDIRGTDWTDQTAKQRPGMRVTTYVLDVNENSASFDATTRRRSQLFLTAKYGGFDDTDGDGNPYTPANNQGVYNSRHWEKETAPGEAKTYFLASDAKAVLKALDDIFVAATKVSNTISTPATSSNQLSTDDGYYYIASFDAERWSGDLKRNTVKLDANGNVQLGNVATALSAAKQLDLLSDGQTDNRKIIAGLENYESNGGKAVKFTWDDIEPALRAHLNKANPTATADSAGQDRLAFIRGYRNKEGTAFRLRSSRMGDIVNSGASYSAAPTTRYNSSPAYKTFYNTNKTRTKAVFVGANDGMLHAFNADTMDELFAYIPSWLGPKLSQLSATTYNSSGHTSYVDAQSVVAEAEVGGAWKTVLVSGTGGGGQGVFALDVTDPAAFAAGKVLWEFTDANDPDLGNVVGQPQIVKLRTSAPNASTPTYKWFAAVASGVNNYVNDGTGRYSTSGSPALFLLDLSKPANTAWSLGTNFFKVSLPITNSVADGTQEVTTAGVGTGQGKATGLIHFDYTNGTSDAVEFFYMGDLHGQFWKLDMAKANLSSPTNTDWNLQKLSAYKKTDGVTAIPMYIAKDAGGKVQPISMTPTIAFGPQGTYILAFGTGKYLEAKDNSIDSQTQTQSFYVLYDSGNKKTESIQEDTDNLARFNGRARLEKGTISSSGAITVNTFYWNNPRDASSVSGVNKKAGWFIDFPKGGSSGGERQITSAALFGQNIMFSSLLPPSASQSACAGGASYFYEANLASGLGQLTTVSTGAQGAPIVFNVGSTVSDSDSVGTRTRTDKAVFGRPGAAGDDKLIFSETKTASSSVGRLSWRMINNYNELKLKDASSW